MEGERFPQKPIDTHPLEVESFFDDVTTVEDDGWNQIPYPEEIESAEPTPEMMRTRDHLNAVNETALHNILHQELRKAGASHVLSASYIATSDVKVTEGTDDTSFLGRYGSRTIEMNAHVLSSSASDAAREYLNEQLGLWQDRSGFLAEKLLPENNLLNKALNSFLHGAETRAFNANLHTWQDAWDRRHEIESKLTEVFQWIGTVHTFIHEELHALTDSGTHFDTHGGVSRKVGFDTDETKEVQKLINGEQITDYESARRSTGINEGVTELISARLAREYLRQSPRFSAAQKYTPDLLHESRISYTTEMMVVEQYIALISALTDTPEDVVLNGLWGEYLKNGTYLPDELADVLHEHIPELSDEELTAGMRTLDRVLSEENFTPDSAFYDSYKELLRRLPENTQEKVQEKLAVLNIKYFGDPESVSAAEINPPIAHY